MTDISGAADLIETARDALLRDLLPVLPTERRYLAAMIANAMAIAAREERLGAAARARESEGLAALLGAGRQPLRGADGATETPLRGADGATETPLRDADGAADQPLRGADGATDPPLRGADGEGASDDLAALRRAVARQIRAGHFDADARSAALVDELARIARDQVAISNPKALRPPPGSPSPEAESIAGTPR